MKKLFVFAAFATLLNVHYADAQQKKSVGTKVKNIAKDVGKGVGTAAKTIGTATKDAGNKVAETTSKGASKVTDQVYKDKVGPDNQKIYIDNHSRYYWVDDKGHHQYVKEDQLKGKPED